MESMMEKMIMRTMKKVMLLCCALLLTGAAHVFAHVQNEKNLYSDIEYSEAKEQIVILHGIRAISLEGGANLYKPFELLTRSDLAFWAGTFHGLGGEGASPEQIREAAHSEGLVSSLEGNATYEDVNRAYFAGLVEVEEADATLSREAFALFMGRFFSEQVDGKTLFDMAEYGEGPTGMVEEVEKSTVTEGGSTYDVFRISIDGEWHQVSNHPKILNGPVDLTQWQGKFVEASWFAPGHADGEGQLEIIKVGEEQFTEEEIAAPSDNVSEGHSVETEQDTDSGDHGLEDTERSGGVDGGEQSVEPDSRAVSGSEAGRSAESGETPGTSIPLTLIIGGVLLVVIILWLVLRRK